MHKTLGGKDGGLNYFQFEEGRKWKYWAKFGLNSQKLYFKFKG